MSFKVIVSRNECTSCGNCEEECPEYFVIDDKGLSHIPGSARINVNDDEIELEDVKCFLEAAISCPVLCIHVYEDGEEIS
jgi:ferredoxin